MQPADSLLSECENVIADFFIKEDLYPPLLSLRLFRKYSQAYNTETHV
jgi:hypothetical protein